MICRRCKTKYDYQNVKQYPWGNQYCCADCFLNIKTPNTQKTKFKIGDMVTFINIHKTKLLFRRFKIIDIKYYTKIKYLVDTKSVLHYNTLADESDLIKI